MPRLLRLEQLETRETPAVVGTLDPSFGTAGKAVFPAAVTVNAVAVDTLGRTVVVGTTASGPGGSDIFVERFTPAGGVDTSFGTAGIVTVDFSAGADVGNGVAIDAHNNVVVIGTSTAGGMARMAIARLSASNGALDTSFGLAGSGELLLAAPSGYTGLAGNGVTTDTTGAVVAVGTATAGGLGDFTVVRLNAAGTAVDTGFNGGAAKVVAAPFNEQARAIAQDVNGAIVVAGSSANGGVSKFAVARLTSTGGMDTSFNSGTLLTYNTVAASSDTAADVDADAAGNVYLVGTSTVGAVSKLAVARVTAAGAPDGTFGSGGVFTLDPGGRGTSAGTGLAVLPSGRIAVSGDTQVSVAATAFTVLQLLPNGTLDTGFNTPGATPGVNVFAFGAGPVDTSSGGLAVTANGRIVVAGVQTSAVGVPGVAVEVARLIGTVEQGQTLAVSGTPNGQAQVFVPPADATGTFGSTATATVSPFGNLTANIRVASGDVDGDGVPDLIAVTGPGTAIRVTVISGADGKTVLVAPFDPFGGDFNGGGFVAAGDFNGDGRAEFVVTPDQGGGPRVSIFTLGADGKVATLANFFGIDDPNFRGGARAAVGDINGDGVPDLAVSAGFLGGPRISIYDGKTVLSATRTNLVHDFFGFPGTDAVSLRNGAFVALGDVNGDGYADLILGGGPGGAPRVFVLSGKQIAANDVDGAQANPIANFYVAGNQSDRGGVRVAALDADGDNRADVAVGSGENAPGRVRVYLGKNITTTVEPTTFQDITPFGSEALVGGVYVG